MNIAEKLDLAIKLKENGTTEGFYSVPYKGGTLHKPIYMTNEEWNAFLSAMPEAARNRDELEETLADKQKEILEKFEENINEMHGIAERDAFSYGFRLGVQLIYSSEAHFRGSDQREIYSPKDRPRGLSRRRLRLRDRP